MALDPVHYHDIQWQHREEHGELWWIQIAPDRFSGIQRKFNMYKSWGQLFAPTEEDPECPQRLVAHFRALAAVLALRLDRIKAGNMNFDMSPEHYAEELPRFNREAHDLIHVLNCMGTAYDTLLLGYNSTNRGSTRQGAALQAKPAWTEADLGKDAKNILAQAKDLNTASHRAVKEYNGRQERMLEENRAARMQAAELRGGGGGNSHPRTLPTGVKPEMLAPKILGSADLSETQWKEFKRQASNYSQT